MGIISTAARGPSSDQAGRSAVGDAHCQSATGIWILATSGDWPDVVGPVRDSDRTPVGWVSYGAVLQLTGHLEGAVDEPAELVELILGEVAQVEPLDLLLEHGAVEARGDY